MSASIHADGVEYVVRRATLDDVESIVRLLADDQIGTRRDGGDLSDYRRAFATIDADPAQRLVVVAEPSGAVAATLQLTYIPGMARRGAMRAQIEAVRVRRDLRSRGVGHALLGWTIDQARDRGCALVQLTADKRREDAHRFYERFGFVASHQGFKLRLTDA